MPQRNSNKHKTGRSTDHEKEQTKETYDNDDLLKELPPNTFEEQNVHILKAKNKTLQLANQNIKEIAKIYGGRIGDLVWTDFTGNINKYERRTINDVEYNYEVETEAKKTIKIKGKGELTLTININCDKPANNTNGPTKPHIGYTVYGNYVREGNTEKCKRIIGHVLMHQTEILIYRKPPSEYKKHEDDLTQSEIILFYKPYPIIKPY